VLEPQTCTCYCMRMATLERRVQLLLDPRQYAALEREARAQNRSVGSLIRESIDARFGVDLSRRRFALARLLASADGPDAPPMGDWEEIKRDLDEDQYTEDPTA
jgi:hypothetical protein